MAKVKVKGIQELARKLNANLRIATNKLFRDKGIREKIGSIVVSDIKKNVSFGSPAKSTIKTRKYLEKFNTTDSAYSRNKLNAVFTGELLKDLQNNVIGNTNDLEFIVEHSDKKHKKYKSKNGSFGKSIAFDKLSSILIDDLGYDYLQLTDKAKKKIANLIRDRFFDLLK